MSFWDKLKPAAPAAPAAIGTDVTSDGKWLLYEDAKTGSPAEAELKMFPLTPDAKPFTVLEPVANPSNARLKPGSNDWLAYESNQSGRSEVYLTRFPHPGAKYQVSKDGGSQVVWSKDGKTLFYLDELRKMTAVSVEVANDSVRIGSPKSIFATGIRHSIPVEAFDVTPLLDENPDRWLRIPMFNSEARSLNLSNCVALVLFEALRQQGFPTEV